MRSGTSERYDLIVGALGQDGFYLQEFLKSQGRNVLSIDTNGLVGQEIYDTDFTISDAKKVSDLISRYPIDHIYFLAAYHHSAEQQDANNIDTLKSSMEIHVYALDNFLRAIIKYRPKARIFYAASSHLFSGMSLSNSKKQVLVDEETPFSPRGWYAISKAAGVELIESYRSKGIFAVCGLLFNHESARRPKTFLTSKLTHGALDAFQDNKTKIEILDAKTQVDWGYAPDYVEAMFLSLEHNKAQNYIIATGKLNSVADYAECVYGLLGLDWRDFVTVNSKTHKKIGNAATLAGNSARLTGATGWRARTSFEKMVARILHETAKKRNVQLKEK